MDVSQESIDYFCCNYFGYGKLASPIWLLGMEEGFSAKTTSGVTTPQKQLWQRIAAFRNEKYVVDLKTTQKLLYGKSSLEDGIQKTWNCLVRTLMHLDGVQDAFISTKSKRAEVRAYQANNLGSSDSNHALIELSPFSAPSINDWPYKELTIQGKTYRNRTDLTHFLIERTRILNELRTTYQPKVILAYGTEYRDNYSKVLSENATFKKINLTHSDGSTTYFEMCKDDITTMILTQHPSRRYVMDGSGWLQYFGDLAKYIKDCM
ncbi:MAG: hypothetical protein MI749_20925 [Desulfovibrionales bacterium]|nr:hypothetical protein [Desulfovibrionales bacterium]